MSGVNKVILVGNVGRDPEVRRNREGHQIAYFSVATSQRWKDKHTGRQQEKTDWHNIVVFDPDAVATVEKRLTKGTKVYIEGRLATRSWETRDGDKRSKTEVVLIRFKSKLFSLDPARGDYAPHTPSPEDYGYDDSYGYGYEEREH